MQQSNEPAGPGHAQPQRPGGGGKWALLFAAGLAAGAATMVLTAGSGRRMLRQCWRQFRQGLPKGSYAVAPLHHALMGRSKREIAEVLGPPPAAAMEATGPGRGVPADFWGADVWYYPLDPGRQLAVAITFRRGAARAVEWLAPPAARSR